MTQELLIELLEQHKTTCNYTFNAITQENSAQKLNDETASVGFILRHIGEITLMYGQFFGIPTQVENTTMGFSDEGKEYDVEESHQLIKDGYAMLDNLIKDIPESDWLQTIDTPFFGAVSRVKLLGHILYHITYHCGQITLTLKRGK
ncbi:DinB family protein [Allomuricauda sp. NBRC 101325]|uniref:DinB family protein n=1 Tax=Allomuricauda sp. NBRC 101325 TaxID=1113758 RepID=UPI0024A579D5|nr:DinB family protein [Muricauda sp. NBRC 101325]GLU44210.1 hypothetical protein Musp01_18340 [Muricauda sp. NBRC 101325]